MLAGVWRSRALASAGCSGWLAGCLCFGVVGATFCLVLDRQKMAVLAFSLSGQQQHIGSPDGEAQHRRQGIASPVCDLFVIGGLPGRTSQATVCMEWQREALERVRIVIIE